MLEVVSSILRQYNNDHGLQNVPIKVDWLIPYAEERGHVDKINLQEVDFDSENVVARVVKYRGEASPYSGQLNCANIQYPKDQNLCWRRFGVCKEIYHCMIDQLESDRVSTLEDLKKLTELLVADTTNITGSFPPFEKEQSAELFALETLLPVEHRLALKARIDDGILTYWQVADRFKVPEFYSRLAFQEGYLRATQALRGKLIELHQP